MSPMAATLGPSSVAAGLVGSGSGARLPNVHMGPVCGGGTRVKNEQRTSGSATKNQRVTFIRGKRKRNKSRVSK